MATYRLLLGVTSYADLAAYTAFGDFHQEYHKAT